MTDYFPALDTVIPDHLPACCRKTLRAGVRVHPKFEVADGWQIDCLYCAAEYVLFHGHWVNKTITIEVRAR